MGWTTTECPICASTQYSSIVDGERKPPDLRIAEAIDGLDGVGSATKRNIIQSFDSFSALKDADVHRLTEIDLVGTTTAESIVEAT